MKDTETKTENIDVKELKTKAFITDLLAGIDRDNKIEDIVAYIIKEVGLFTHSDMVCIYKPCKEHGKVSMLHKWKADNSSVKDDIIRDISEFDRDDRIESLKSNRTMVVEDRENIRDSMPVEYERMVKCGIHTLFIIPLFSKHKMMSCLCLLEPKLTEFSLSESAWLYLGQEIDRLYNQEIINRKHLLFTEGIRSSNLSEFLVDYTKNRYEALRITRVLSNVIPEEGEWEWIRKFYASIIKPEYREEFLRRTDRDYMETILCREHNSFSIDIEREVNGNNTWFRLEFSIVSHDENGHLERFVVLVKDITQTKKDEEEHRQMITALSSFYKVTFKIDLTSGFTQVIKHSDIISTHYPDGLIPQKVFLDTFLNRMVETEYTELVREFMDLDTIKQRLKDTDVLSCEYRGKQIEWGRIVLAPAKWDKDGRLEKVVFAIQDITEQKSREEWMQFKIEHDELTGALNRTAFNRVTKLLESSSFPFALVLLDIDKFKSINDTYGHDAGDRVLKHLVCILNEEMRAVDKVFRLGGDEFAVIMNRLTAEQAVTAKNIIKRVNDAIMLGMNGLPPFSISAGITFSESGYDENIYRNADAALYHTKETTRRGCSIFEEIQPIFV